MKTTKKISRGVLKDFAVLNFAGALLEVSLHENKDAIRRNSDNKNYKLNKRIDRRIKTLREKTKEVLTGIGYQCDENDEAYAKKRLKNVGVLLYWFESMNIDLNLELLALNILFVNFDPNERQNQTLHEDYLYFTKSENYLDDNAELIGELLSDDKETEMFLLSYECIEKLKR